MSASFSQGGLAKLRGVLDGEGCADGGMSSMPVFSPHLCALIAMESDRNVVQDAEFVAHRDATKGPNSHIGHVQKEFCWNSFEQ